MSVVSVISVVLVIKIIVLVNECSFTECVFFLSQRMLF